MKISEFLIESVNILDPKTVKKITNQEFHLVTNRAELGSGFYNKVYVADQFSVNKVVAIGQHPQNNGYLRYINEVLNANHNRYLPQIFNVSMFDGDPETDFRKYYVVQIERLLPVEDISEEEILQLLEQTFGHRLTSKEKVEIRQKSKEWGNEWFSSSPYFEYLVRYIDSSILGYQNRDPLLKSVKKTSDTMATFVNPELKNTIRIMKKFKNNSGLRSDLHLHNIMFRRSPYGIQMIFTDPFHD